MQFSPLCTPDVSVKADSFEGEAVPVRCKRWSCPVCAPINKRKVIALGIAGRPRALLTLTVSSKHYETPEEAAAALKRGLRLLRLDLSRHPKLESFEYLAVFEEHKSGFPHMHLLITGKFIPWKYLRDTWERITGSVHVHIRKIRNNHQAAAYTAKYVSKSLAAFAGCKRWWRSHGYPRHEVEPTPEPRHGPKWGRFEMNIGQMAFNLRLAGYRVERGKGGRVIWRWDLTDGQPPGWQWSASGGRPYVQRKGWP